MKKIILIIVLIFFTVFQGANASNIDILPTMQSKSNIEDRVWVCTFQLVWNDLMEKFAFGVVKFPDGTPDTANELNKSNFTVEDISENCLYKYIGRITKNTKSVIKKAIKRKFNETSDLLDEIDLTPDKKGYVLYAMLKKDFSFKNAFDKLGMSSFKNTETEFFGINGNSSPELRDGVNVLFYDSPDDFAVALETSGRDVVYFYKTQNTKTFDSIYYDMLKKSELYSDNTHFSKMDELKIPNLKFFEEKEFTELEGKRIKGSLLMIDKALETVKFSMNNEGVQLKSEAVVTIVTSAGPNQAAPRYFYLDDTFVMFLKEKGKNKPYFALRVNDISKFVSFE